MRYLFLIVGLLFSTSVFAVGFSVSSSSFPADGAIPKAYSCDGKNTAPAISWENPPSGTQSFAVVVSDPDAPSGTFYHWVVYNIPEHVTSLPKGGQLPAGAMTARNSKGTTGYAGPCPPSGSTHHYIFTVYALNKMLDLPPGSDADIVLNNIKSNAIIQTEVTGTYGR